MAPFDGLGDLYPFEQRYLQLGKLRYHYLDEGDGDPVVMLHGNPTWSFYYRNLTKRLRSQYRCIVPDHIGCGFSDKPGDEDYNYTFSQRIDDLEQLLDELGLVKNITLVLHDWGGMIGMGYAARHPERIRRLVLLNTAAFSLPSTKSFPWPLWLCRNTALGSFLVRGFNAFSGIAARVGVKRKALPPKVRKAYCMPYNNWNNRIATLRFVQDIPLRPADPGYAEIQNISQSLDAFKDTPTFIGWGLKDFVFDEHFLKEWETRMPHAEVHRYEDCGHYILEDAQEELLPLIDKFLSDHPIQKKK